MKPKNMPASILVVVYVLLSLQVFAEQICFARGEDKPRVLRYTVESKLTKTK